MSPTDGYTEDDVRLVAEALRSRGGVTWSAAIQDAHNVLDALAGAGRLRTAAGDAVEGQTIQERDDAEEWADRLARAIGATTGADVGEHSNVNNPWRVALGAIEALAGRLQNLPPAAGDEPAELDADELLLYRLYRHLDCPTPVDQADHEDCAVVAAESVRVLRAAGRLLPADAWNNTWLDQIVRAVALMAEEADCDGDHGTGQECNDCAWRAIFAAVPTSVKDRVGVGPWVPVEPELDEAVRPIADVPLPGFGAGFGEGDSRLPTTMLRCSDFDTQPEPAEEQR